MNEELLRRCLDALSDHADDLHDQADAAETDDPVHERLESLDVLTADIRKALGEVTKDGEVTK